MIIKVRDKQFKIELVNNYVHRLYNELTEYSEELSEYMNELEDKIKDINAGKLDKVQQRDFLKDSRKRKKEIKDNLLRVRMEMVEELLTSNGLEYDAKWWERKTAPDDINDFVLSCVQKDLSKGKGSGKK